MNSLCAKYSRRGFFFTICQRSDYIICRKPLKQFNRTNQNRRPPLFLINRFRKYCSTNFPRHRFQKYRLPRFPHRRLLVLAVKPVSYTFFLFTHIYNCMATLIFTGGGTAGHCTPCLALLPYVKNDFDKIFYIGSENGIERGIVEKTGIPYYGVPCAKLVRSFTLKNLSIPFKVFSGIKKAGKILDELSPDVVFSKGGYVSLPVVVAAKKRGIPVVSHESDYTAGLANKIAAGYCKKVLTRLPRNRRKR